MILYFPRSPIIKLSALVKHAKRLHNLRNYQHFLMPPKMGQNNVDINLCNVLFKYTNVNTISSTSVSLKSKDKFKEKKKAVHVDLNEISEIVKVELMMSQFDAAIENFKNQMVKYLDVRTRVGAIEGLPIKFEDEDYKLEELVEISRKPNMIVLNVSAFPQIIPNILETLEKSQMNLNPQQEGTTIYIQLPKVTKEHRESLAKSARQYFVKCKDLIGDIRNQHVKHVKKQEDVSTELIFKAESYIGALQKEYVNKADQLLKEKQKELLGQS